MKHVLMLSLVLTIGLSGCQFFGPQKKVVSTSQSNNDSTIVKQKHFNDDPNSPVEWKVGMKKTPEGTYVRHGESVRFTKSGKLAEKIYYKNNKKEGVRLTYHSTGKVYKEQPYVNGRLDGICKRYDRDGKITAEYPYKNGLPGIGLIEYTNLGKARPVPTISIQKVDKIKANGTYNLILALKGEGVKRIKSVEFFEGKLVEGKYYHKNLTPIKNTSRTKGEFQINVPKGYQVNKNLNIIAVAKTTSGLQLILQKSTSVNVRGV
ncbi:MAG: hypothetical protein JEZ14_15485 [Marinilabiliaceae bacterium]|nr:hypothetical protein [Marinilabiliaceae bacterium]